MTNTGTIVAGVYPGSVKTVVSPNTYKDNTWHFAVMSLDPTSGDAQVGLRLYIDGSQVASDTTVTTAESYSGFWRVGYDSLSGWTNAPTSNYSAGSVAYASVYTSALTAAQVTSLYNAGRA